MPKPLSLDIIARGLKRDANGEIAAPDAPGLGIEMSSAGMRRYLQDVEIKVQGRTLYRTPSI